MKTVFEEYLTMAKISAVITLIVIAVYSLINIGELTAVHSVKALLECYHDVEYAVICLLLMTVGYLCCYLYCVIIRMLAVRFGKVHTGRLERCEVKTRRARYSKWNEWVLYFDIGGGKTVRSFRYIKCMDGIVGCKVYTLGCIHICDDFVTDGGSGEMT